MNEAKDPYELDPSKLSTVPFHEFRCPFCRDVLEKKEMQFHVAIPLCKELPKVRMAIKMEYFGVKGLRKLIDASLTIGYGDTSLVLEDFVDHSED